MGRTPKHDKYPDPLDELYARQRPPKQDRILTPVSEQTRFLLQQFSRSNSVSCQLARAAVHIAVRAVLQYPDRIEELRSDLREKRYTDGPDAWPDALGEAMIDYLQRKLVERVLEEDRRADNMDEQAIQRKKWREYKRKYRDFGAKHPGPGRPPKNPKQKRFKKYE